MDLFSRFARDAVMYVQRKRFCINPNEGFAQQLMVSSESGVCQTFIIKTIILVLVSTTFLTCFPSLVVMVLKAAGEDKVFTKCKQDLSVLLTVTVSKYFYTFCTNIWFQIIIFLMPLRDL